MRLVLEMNEERPPRVAIGMPLFNAERYLEETLNSILAQTYRDFTLIISDNASTDSTEQICRRRAAEDTRISYSRNDRNMGATFNFNRVFALSQSEYFKHAAYDDLLAPTYLERLVEMLDREQNVVLAFPICQPIHDDGQPNSTAPRLSELNLRQKTPHERLRRYIPGGGAERMCDPVFGVFRSAALRQTQVIGNYISSDAILLGEIALYGELAQVPETLFFERYHVKGSVLGSPTLDDRYAWFDPNLRGRWTNRLFAWRWLIELIKAIDRAPLDVAEKLRCYGTLYFFIRKNRRDLVLNLIRAFKLLVKPTAVRIFGPGAFARWRAQAPALSEADP